MAKPTERRSPRGNPSADRAPKRSITVPTLPDGSIDLDKINAVQRGKLRRAFAATPAAAVAPPPTSTDAAAPPAAPAARRPGRVPRKATVFVVGVGTMAIAYGLSLLFTRVLKLSPEDADAALQLTNEDVDTMVTAVQPLLDAHLGPYLPDLATIDSPELHAVGEVVQVYAPKVAGVVGERLMGLFTPKAETPRPRPQAVPFTPRPHDDAAPVEPAPMAAAAPTPAAADIDPDLLEAIGD